MKSLLFGLCFAIGMLFCAPAALVAQDAEKIAEADDAQDILYLSDDGIVILRLHIRIDGKSYRTVWNEFIDETFKSFDRDGDGELNSQERTSLTEYRGILTQSGMIGASGPQGSDAARNPDSDGDGRVTKDDLAKYFDRIGFRPFTTQIVPAQPQQQRGFVVSGMQQNGTPVPVFAKLDGDGDGKLSADEFKKALETLHKSDLDDDQTISLAELSPAANPFAGAVFSGMMASPSQPQTNFISLSSDESPVKLVQQLLTRYDTESAADGQAKDNMLSANELKLSPEVFGTFDLDSSGQLDFDELRQFIGNPRPSMELLVQLGRPQQGEQVIQLKAARPDLEKKVRTASGAASLTLETVQLELTADTAWGRDLSEVYKRQFQAADSDNNAYLEMKEVERNGLFRNTFALMDRDKDGKLFEEEMLAFFARQRSANESRSVLSITDQGRDFFKILDLDGDGRLSRSEFASASERMPVWDLDGDGFVGETEVPRQFRLFLSRGTSNLPGTPRVATSPYSTNGRRPANSSTEPVWFRKMDRNSDGEISRREFLGSKADFDKLDQDGNGLIDGGEAYRTE